ELEQLIRHHKELYYKGKPEISDQEYDRLEDELRRINPKNPVLNLVGSKIKGAKIKHQKKMLSLAKTYDLEELLKWVGQNDVVATHKIDGNSCSLIYEKGHLIQAKTRGDGEFGEDITENIKWALNIPFNINEELTFEVRGELYCEETDFLNLTDEMLQRGLDRPSSARNIVAGLLGRRDHLDLNKYIRFMAYDILIEKDDFNYEVEKFNYLKKLGFMTPEFYLVKTKEEIKDVIEHCFDFYQNGHYAIDGIVFTYNDIHYQRELGYTAHHPRYKIAYKFKGETKKTKIENIIWSVSRNGILTPVAQVEPVELAGAVISNVTLHNWGMVHTHNLKIGDCIEIVRSGEVIPKYLRTITESQNQVDYPKVCPSCACPTIVEGIWLKCKNKSCPGQFIEEIIHFVKNIGIDDLSKKRLEQLIQKGKVKNIVD
ncbi:MAG: hypothetical protein D6707_00040, partial [Bacteroidetes bacterium]